MTKTYLAYIFSSSFDENESKNIGESRIQGYGQYTFFLQNSIEYKSFLLLTKLYVYFITFRPHCVYTIDWIGQITKKVSDVQFSYLKNQQKYALFTNVFLEK